MSLRHVSRHISRFACLMLVLSSCKAEPEKQETMAAKAANGEPASDQGKQEQAPKGEAQAAKVGAAKAEEANAEKQSPIPDIPKDRSKPPTVGEWQAAKPINTQEPHSRAENCEMKIVREWLKVYCHGDITQYSELSGFGEKLKDYFVSVRKGKSADFVVRLREGQTMKAKIQRNDAREAVLYVSWPPGVDKPVHIALGRGNEPEKKTEERKKIQKQKKATLPR